MKWIGVLFCLIGLSVCSPPVTKNRKDIQAFRDALEKSRIDDGVLLDSRMISAPPDSSVWENSGKFDGDILLDDSQIEDMVADYAGGNTSSSGNRAAYIVANSRWPNNELIYVFGANEFDAAQRQAIQTAITWIEHFSCVRFRRRTNERVFVTIRGSGSGCYAHVGFSTVHPNRVANLARNTPGRGCLNHVVIIHEFLHSLGFWHMQQTYERDTFVRINWENIQNGAQHNFNRLARNRVSLLSLPYEYTSCMHYSSHAFSSNRQPTITALRNNQGVMGQRQHASYWDWLRLRRHYNCPGAWNTFDMQRLKDEVERTLPLIHMNLPAPKKGIFTDEDVAYINSLKENEDNI